MILCPNCHRMATRRVLLEREQRKLKANPYNRKHGHAAGSLHVAPGVCEVVLGSNTLVGQGCFIRVDESQLLSLNLGPEGQLEISLELYNQADELVALTDKNERITGDPSPWDLQFDYQHLRLRSRPNDVVLDLRADCRPMALRAKLWRRGVSVDARSAKILINGGPLAGMVMSGNRMEGHCLAVSSHSGACGIMPMNLHPTDPAFSHPIPRSSS